MSCRSEDGVGSAEIAIFRCKFSELKCEATANSVTGPVCVNSNIIGVLTNHRNSGIWSLLVLYWNKGCRRDRWVPAAVFGVHDKTETVRRVDFPVPVKIRNWYGGAIKGIDLIYEEKPEKDTDFTNLICAGSSRLFYLVLDAAAGGWGSLYLD